MAKFELKLPKMGESVAEATITSWLKEVGDSIEIDDAVVEIATDKVDSDVPSEVAGVLLSKNFELDQVVKVGEVLAVIETEDLDSAMESEQKAIPLEPQVEVVVEEQKDTFQAAAEVAEEIVQLKEQIQPVVSNEKRFYSPLVKNIAAQENIKQEELETISGTGQNNRLSLIHI